MLIKRLEPAHTYLQFTDHDSIMMGATKEMRRTVHNDKTRAAMQATYDVVDDFDRIFERRSDVALMHDLRFDSPDGNMHIDHLFITHNFHVFIVESRTTGATLSIGDDKKFISTDHTGNACAIPSPIRQLRRNRAMFKRVLRKLDLPKRFGRELTPTFHYYLLINPGTILLNRSEIDFDYFVTPAQLISLINEQAKRSSLLSFFEKMPTTQLRRTSRQIAKMHAPKKVRFSSKFRHIPIPN